MDCRWVFELFFQRPENHTMLLRKHVYLGNMGNSYLFVALDALILIKQRNFIFLQIRKAIT